MKRKLLPLILLFWIIIPVCSVIAANSDENLIVLSRGHIENVGDYPTDGSWIESPERIGTVGESKRIEGFELKLGAGLPTDMEIRYNVHVQNKGWLYDEEDTNNWPKNGEYAGTRGESLRIEAIKIVLTDLEGNTYSGYHINYQGHVQNIGEQPQNSSEWFADGEQLGTVGSSQRLEALTLRIVKDDVDSDDISIYNSLLSQIDGLNAEDYTETSWNNLQTAISDNKVSDKNTQEEITAAVTAIKDKVTLLENLVTSKVYDTVGTYGPEFERQTIDSDVIITTSGVVLQNLDISGNLIIDKGVGDGDVTLNNVTVTGDLRVRGGGENSIHINGGQYGSIRVESTPTGAVRIVATDLSGAEIVLSEDASGEELILEGAFDSVSIQAPSVTVTTRGNTNIATMELGEAADSAIVNLGSNTTVTNLTVGGEGTHINGSGTVENAEIDSNSAVFENAPENYTVDTGVEIQPVIPTPNTGGGTGGSGGGDGVSKISLSVTTAPIVIPLKTYDGTGATNVTAAAVDVANVSGIVSGDDVTVLATATYDNKNAGDNKTINMTYALSGADASKYKVPASATITTLGTIDKKQLNTPSSSTATKEYDGTAALVSTITDELGQVFGDDLVITQAATYSDSVVGTGKTVDFSYNLSGTDAGNYLAPAAQSDKSTGTITSKKLSINWNNNFKATYGSVQSTKTYDGNNKAFYVGLPSSPAGVISNSSTSTEFNTGIENITVNASAAYDNVNAGDRTITVTYTLAGDVAKNYEIENTSEEFDGSIVKYQLTVSEANTPLPYSKTYDGLETAYFSTASADAISVTPDNVVASDTVTLMANAEFSDKNVGVDKSITITYHFDNSISIPVQNNYSLPVNDTTQTANISPIKLSTTSAYIEEDLKSKEYDGTSEGVVDIVKGINCSDSDTKAFINDLNTNKTLVFSTSSTYYTDASCTNETSGPGSNLYLKYIVTLSGASGGNYVFSDNSSSYSASVNDGSITAKTLSVDTSFIETSKTYDGTATVYTNKTITREDSASAITDYQVDNSYINGLAIGETVDLKVTASYADENAADPKTINLDYTLSGDNAGHYTLADASIDNGKINPIQLEYNTTPFTTNYGLKTYDGTTIVRYNGKYYKDYDKNSSGTELKDCVFGILDADKDFITVLTSATFADKNAGQNKPITFSYSLSAGTSGNRTGNYLAPVTNNNSGVTAEIQKRILNYQNIEGVETIKKVDGSSSAAVNGVTFDPTFDATNYRGLISGDSVSLSCTADYGAVDYSQENYGAVTKIATEGQHQIILSPVLTGADSANYRMDPLASLNGTIMPNNGLITASYSSGSWSPWGNIFAYYASLTPPNNDSGFKIFMYYNSTGTFYGISSDGIVYSVSLAYNATEITGFATYSSTTYNGQALPLNVAVDNMTLQVYGVDSDGFVLAIGFDGTNYKCYYWDGVAWMADTYVSPTGEFGLSCYGAPVNPTYGMVDSNPYIVYQDNGGIIYRTSLKDVSGVDQQICEAPTPPSDFSRQLIYYNGTTAALFAY
ncbi:YDG domain-containing protein [Eubacteriaceae bacterium ES3]|nr:YDG domain-containing protein [Eubacteriaceae bacterium ES3]